MNAQGLDAIVIGAGIAGTSIAYFLSDRAKVLVLERESQPGVHSTGRSAALFSETYGNAQIRALTRASRAFFERPPRDFAAHALLHPRGALVIASREQAARSRSDYETMRTHSRRTCDCSTPMRCARSCRSWSPNTRSSGCWSRARPTSTSTPCTRDSCAG
jgi:glycine/D-amino acid oxidase-like deaminating enzyme